MGTSLMVVLLVGLSILHGSDGHDYCERNDMMALMVRLRDLSTEYHTEMKKTNDEISQLKGKVSKMNSILKSKITQLSGNVSQFENDVQELKTKRATEQIIAFYVYSPNGHTSAYNSTVFTAHVTNVGGAYDTTTGVFTCPVTGLFTFSVTVGSRSPNDGSYGKVQCDINRNSVQVTSASSFTSKESYDYNQGSATVYLRLAVGDIVYLQCTGWNYVRTINHETMFGGALITT